MRRPFSSATVKEAGVHARSSPAQRLPLPTPRPVAEKPVPATKKLAPISREKLETAKRLLEDVGIDPSILEKLVGRIKDIDSEIEELEEEIRVAKARIRDLEEEKTRIYRVLSSFIT